MTEITGPQAAAFLRDVVDGQRITSENVGELIGVVRELAGVVGELQRRVFDLEDRLEGARVVTRGGASRTFPPDEYELYLPSAKTQTDE